MKKTITSLFSMLFCAVTLPLTAGVTQTIEPKLNGFVRQFENDGIYTYENVEVKKVSAYSREMVMDFDLTSLTIDSKQATLKLYCSSVDTDAPFIISASGMKQNLGEITFLQIPLIQVKAVDIHTNKTRCNGTWLEFDVTDFIKSLTAEEKAIAFRIAILSDNGPLVKFSTTKTINKPQLVFSDTPIDGVYEVPYVGIKSASSTGNPPMVGVPKFALDGSGLLPDMCHTNAADNVAWRTTGGALPHTFKIELTEEINLKKLHIWNLNWANGTNKTDMSGRGPKEMDIYVSTSTDDLSAVAYTDERWLKVQESFLAKAGITTSYQGEEVLIDRTPLCRWIGFNIKTIHTTASYTGLSEVKIYKEVKNGGVSSQDQVISELNVKRLSGKTVIEQAKGKCVIIFDTNGRVYYSGTISEDYFEIESDDFLLVKLSSVK